MCTVDDSFAKYAMMLQYVSIDRIGRTTFITIIIIIQ